jgi:hypothetical protein
MSNSVFGYQWDRAASAPQNAVATARSGFAVSRT